ncbi:MAG: hypothetical protein ACRCWG_06520 [Sarcina sp.]
MKIKIEVPNGIGTFTDWSGDELYINGKSATEFFKQVGKMIKEKGIENPIVNLNMIFDIDDSKEIIVEETI